MARITETEMDQIREAWGRGLTRASFGGASGSCQLTGSVAFVALYVCEDEAQLEDDFKSGVKFSLSVGAYRKLRADMAALFPPPPPPPKPVKIVLPPKPNAITRQTMDKTDAGQEVVRSKDAAEMFDKLGI